MRKKGWGDIALTIVLFLLLGMILIPFLWMFFNSFKTNTEIFAGNRLLPERFSADNYIFAWSRGNFSRYFFNSAVTTIAVVVLRLVLAGPASYAFAKLRIRKYPVFFYLFLIGLSVPAESYILSLFLQIRDMGLVDTLTGLVLPMVFTGLPFSVFLLRNFFLDLPDALIEAAQIDGAGVGAVFFKVMLPLSKPGLLVISVLSFLDAWNEYMLSMLVLISPDKKTIPLGIVKFAGENISNYGAVFAGSVISILPSIIIYCLLQKTFIQGMTVGAVKE